MSGDDLFRDPKPAADPLDFIGCLGLLVIWLGPGIVLGLLAAWVLS